MRKRKQIAIFGRTGSVAPFLAGFLLLVALAFVFCWRVATTDPSWSVSAPTPRPQPNSPAAAAPKPVEQAAPAVRERVEPEEETVVELPVRPAAPTPAKSTAEAETPSVDSAQVSAYLAAHLGQTIPLLRNGARRDVVLAAFTDDQIMVRAGTDDLTTISRASLGADQLRLWK